MKSRSPALLPLGLFLAAITSSHAGTVMAVTGDNGYGNFDAKSFYEVDTATSASTLKGTSTIVPNQLAYDAASGNYYYMDHTGSSFYRFDLALGQEHFIADLITEGVMPSGKTGSGGGDFYNGKYYFTYEDGAEEIVVISFNDDGSQIVSYTPVSPANLGDFSLLHDGSSNAGMGNFGDFAIDVSSGFMYGSSVMTRDDGSGGTEPYSAFWRVDLTDPDFTMAMISNALPNIYQMAFDENGELWANTWTSGGTLVHLDKTTGAEISSQNLNLGGTNTGGNFYDMASTGTRSAVVPEPASVTLLGGILGLGLLARRRK
jgi:hypothetical protein